MYEKAVITCPNCKNKLRVPNDRGIILVTCPVCKHVVRHSGVENPNVREEPKKITPSIFSKVPEGKDHSSVSGGVGGKDGTKIERNVKMKRNLICSRKASLRGVAMKYAIILDGKEVGRLGSGQTLRIPVAEGVPYTLSLVPHPGFMLENFGPRTIVVGKQDVNVWVDTSKDPFVFKITGSENDSKFPGMVESMCRKLVNLTAEVAGRNLPCYYVMEEDCVTLKAVAGGRELMRTYYRELSDYAVSKLERWEQVEMSKQFGVELSLSGRVAHARVHRDGYCVFLNAK